ncbi:MAG: pentapeptide repeat-containing protein [Xanthobacteraceae bacterium]
MGINITEGTVRRDWIKIASATVETVVQALALGKDGISAATSSFFRGVEAIRGEDSLEIRANCLVLETLAYASSATIATTPLDRVPDKAEIRKLLDNIIERASGLAAEINIVLESEDLDFPETFPLFIDAASQIYHELRLCRPKESPDVVAAKFKRFVARGLIKIRSRDPDYFSPVVDALTGADAVADAKQRAWDRYRASLIKRFEDEPLFGEDEKTGATLAQVYQPLRAWFDEHDDSDELEPDEQESGTKKKIRRTVGMLDELVRDWLSKDDATDRVRLISGGPGSGKSTFAKYLAASVAPQLNWRVVFVPLQRLRGTGLLEGRIDDYFRRQLDEPFDIETAPLHSMGRDAHRNWLIIFDGLDELAKEGTTSESAALDFASALADWRGRVGSLAVHFLVLGRAPSMQEARRRLALQGKGTLYVADMIPFDKRSKSDSGRELVVDDPKQLGQLDQRPEFWRRWASAKNLSLDPPEAMTTDALSDLTKEPLLAYLLVFSGYVEERWKEAAENRNRIYQAIFNQIWEREKNKPTRIHLNDLGREGFESLMQALGLAAWRGGGRTGDETTFTSIRDTFMQPGLLFKAKKCGAADLGNVALLFYTRKDEEGGRGYEFLHKSFGEYLTARGLVSAFRRWGSQVDNPETDFDVVEFHRRWLKLAGAEPMSREILTFLRNEIRLEASSIDEHQPWKTARDWVRNAEKLMDAAIRDGLPAFEGAVKWRAAEDQELNAEVSLMAMVDACARAAYPSELLGSAEDIGGWMPGPVLLVEFRANRYTFSHFIRRTKTESSWFMTAEEFYFGFSNILLDLMSRLSLQGIVLIGASLAGGSLEGADLRDCMIMGCNFVETDLEGADLRNATIRYTEFASSNLRNADLRGARLDHAYLDRADTEFAKTDGPLKNQRRKRSMALVPPFMRL